MVREIPISKIDYGTNVRMERDADIYSLAKSIEEHDVLQPLVVRPKGNRYEVVCGHRRYKALKLDGFDILVPCIVRTDITNEDIIKVQLEENIQRKQMSALELTEAFDKMKAQSAKRLTDNDIARMLNVSPAWVYQQYQAVRKINETYGANGKAYVRKKGLSAGKILGDLQKKRREKSAVKKKNFVITHTGNTITIKCDNSDVTNYVLSELKKI